MPKLSPSQVSVSFAVNESATVIHPSKEVSDPEALVMLTDELPLYANNVTYQVPEVTFVGSPTANEKLYIVPTEMTVFVT